MYLDELPFKRYAIQPLNETRANCGKYELLQSGKINVEIANFLDSLIDRVELYLSKEANLHSSNRNITIQLSKAEEPVRKSLRIKAYREAPPISLPPNQKHESRKRKIFPESTVYFFGSGALEGETNFIIEKILDKRTKENKAAEYLVKWKGYDETYNTWEPITSFVILFQKIQFWLTF